MHSEHLKNVSIGSVLLGWLVAVAVAALLVFLLTAVGWMSENEPSTMWAVVAVALGFFAGGYLTGTRDIEAPILHGIGIGLMTLVAWFVLNALATLFVDDAAYSALSATTSAALLLVQMIAAVAGAWLADRRALRGDDLGGEPLG